MSVVGVQSGVRPRNRHPSPLGRRTPPGLGWGSPSGAVTLLRPRHAHPLHLPSKWNATDRPDSIRALVTPLPAAERPSARPHRLRKPLDQAQQDTPSPPPDDTMTAPDDTLQPLSYGTAHALVEASARRHRTNPVGCRTPRRTLTTEEWDKRPEATGRDDAKTASAITRRVW